VRLSAHRTVPAAIALTLFAKPLLVQAGAPQLGALAAARAHNTAFVAPPRIVTVVTDADAARTDFDLRRQIGRERSSGGGERQSKKRGGSDSKCELTH
jgi:hypothetical protein